MKKVISLIVALMLMCCAVASVSAEISPTASVSEIYIKVDAVPVPEEGGAATPGINNPGTVDVSSGENVTFTATPADGWEFDHWEIVYGKFDIVSGDMTTPVIVITPNGDSNVRLYAHFVKKGETPSVPDDTTPGEKPDDSPESPTTGYTIPVYAVVGSAIVVAMGALIIFKKKVNA